jgi:hypothetical protein
MFHNPNPPKVAMDIATLELAEMAFLQYQDIPQSRLRAMIFKYLFLNTFIAFSSAMNG